MSKHEYPQAPVVGVTAVVIHAGKVLLVQRGVAPSREQWAFPGGVQKLGETMRQCAEREVAEESGLSITAGEAIDTLDFMATDLHGGLRFHFVIVYLRGVLQGGALRAADDALAAEWFSAAEVQALHITDNTRKILSLLKFLEDS